MQQERTKNKMQIYFCYRLEHCPFEHVELEVMTSQQLEDWGGDKEDDTYFCTL